MCPPTSAGWDQIVPQSAQADFVAAGPEARLQSPAADGPLCPYGTPTGQESTMSLRYLAMIVIEASSSH